MTIVKSPYYDDQTIEAATKQKKDINFQHNAINQSMNRKIFLLVLAILSIGTIFAQTDTTQAPIAPSMPVITLSESEIDQDAQDNDISTLLQSSQDVYVNTAGYTFGQSRFRFRGYDNRNAEVLLNGI